MTDNGVPFGITHIAPAGNEATLMQLATQFGGVA